MAQVRGKDAPTSPTPSPAKSQNLAVHFLRKGEHGFCRMTALNPLYSKRNAPRRYRHLAEIGFR